MIQACRTYCFFSTDAMGVLGKLWKKICVFFAIRELWVFLEMAIFICNCNQSILTLSTSRLPENHFIFQISTKNNFCIFPTPEFHIESILHHRERLDPECNHRIHPLTIQSEKVSQSLEMSTELSFIFCCVFQMDPCHFEKLKVLAGHSGWCETCRWRQPG